MPTQDTFVALVAALAWPALAAVVIWLLWKPIKRLLTQADEAQIEALGMKVSFSAQSAATVASRATLLSQSKAAYTPDPEEIGQIVAEAMRLAYLMPKDGAKVLWVDDRPNNNVVESEIFKANRVEFTYARSTDEALQRLSETSFDAVISDMGRPGDDEAGYSLLQHVKKLYNNLPFVIYAGESTPEQVSQAQSKGAAGLTSRPAELYAMVAKAIHSAKSPPPKS